MRDYASQVTLFHNIFISCGIAAFVFLTFAVVLFFALKIPRVFGELTGRPARMMTGEMQGDTSQLPNDPGPDGDIYSILKK